MKYKRKICVITGTRSEYGLLYWLMKKIQSSDESELQIIVTGSHLLSEFGDTYLDVERDGFSINRKIDILLASDSSVGIGKSMGLAMIGFSDAYVEIKPDIVVVLGDRFEIFSAVSAATVARIPVVHLSGGETTEGAFDEAFRHSITKMAHLHFVSTEEYKERVVQLGENPSKIFNVGAFGMENISKLKLLSRRDLEKSINFKLGKINFLVTYHSVTLEDSTSEQCLLNLLSVLDTIKNAHIIFTQANTDTGGKIINKIINNYVKLNPNKSIFFKTLGQLRYLSIMQYVDGVVGNSSSGLVEAPSFGIGTINIGDRQRGRVKSESVIDCSPDKDEIQKAFNLLLGEKFKKSVTDVKNPYDQGESSEKIYEIIKSFPLNGILKKKFYNIKYLNE